MGLIDRLRNQEDQLTERKEAGVSTEKIAQTIVAFANSLTDDQEGILFIGVSDKGEVKGVPNPDKRQKDVLRIADNSVYPPIPIKQYVLDVDGQSVVAVVVRRSYNGPHFAGTAYVRAGSVNRQASEKQFEQLIAARLSPLRPILQALESQVEVLVDRRVHYGTVERHLAKVVDVNAQCVEFRDVPHGVVFSIASDRISVKTEPGQRKLLIVERA